MVPRLLNLDSKVENLLWCIRTDCVSEAHIPGMGIRCVERTVNEVIDSAGWRAEMKIPDGVVDLLMVLEHPMLEPASGDNIMS